MKIKIEITFENAVQEENESPILIAVRKQREKNILKKKKREVEERVYKEIVKTLCQEIEGKFGISARSMTNSIWIKTPYSEHFVIDLKFSGGLYQDIEVNDSLEVVSIPNVILENRRLAEPIVIKMKEEGIEAVLEAINSIILNDGAILDSIDRFLSEK